MLYSSIMDYLSTWTGPGLRRVSRVWASFFGFAGVALGLISMLAFTPRGSAQTVASVSAGDGYSLFVKTDGTLWATGLDNYGQLGDGMPAFYRATPYQVGNGVASVSAGVYHTMWVKNDGTLWAVGRNWYGLLGDGQITLYRTAPVQVATNVASVAAGLWHTMFVKTDGTLWGMGNNGYGQLGDGTKVDQVLPKQVATGVASVAVGDGYTMFVKTDGTLWAVGYNQYGQLGDGTVLPNGTNRDTPVQVATGVASVAAFANQTFFVKTNGTLWATGANANGQLGDTTNVNKSTPVQIDTGVASVSTGSAHTVYVKTNGTLWATGNNAFGQLGDGTTSTPNISIPELITTGVASVEAGYVHTMFVKTDGTLWGMGTNQYGAIGDGTTTLTQITPVQVTTSPIPAPPVITTQPVGQTAAVGDTFSFSVIATGVGPFTYQWYQDRVPLSFTNSPTFSATAQLVRAGSYTVTVTNAGGIVTSNAAVLSIGSVATTFSLLSPTLPYTGAVQGPTILSSPGGATFTTGGTLTATTVGTYTATATATGSYTGTNNSLTWSITKAPATVTLGGLANTYSGTPKAATATTTPSGLTVNFTYNGSATAPTNAGSYAVVATINEANYTGSTSGTLTIAKAAPVITWATPAAINAGTALSATELNATAHVAGTFVYSPASGAVLAAGSQNLGVTFTPTDTTNYTSASRSVSLTVQAPAGPPAITTPPLSQAIAVGGTVTFTAGASGFPAPTYQWQKNGTDIAGATDNSYTIAAVSLSDAGSYRVVASNSVGSATSAVATLDIGTIPDGFDVTAYLTRNPTAAAIYTGDPYGAWLYYHDHGIYDGEVYDDLFRVEEYLTLYPELFTLFGSDLGGALVHWLTIGRLEGKLGRIPLEFSAAGYFSRNPDVATAVNNDPLLAWGHYWLYGIYEGRAYDEELRVFEYLAINADLTAAFVSDWRQAALHWMRYGRTEGRLGRLPLIFNVTVYLSRNPDVLAVYGTNPTTVFLHYWAYGIDEGRTFDDLFRPDEYLALNPDLAVALGTDRRLAFKHWVRYGQAEGRTGKNP